MTIFNTGALEFSRRSTRHEGEQSKQCCVYARWAGSCVADTAHRALIRSWNSPLSLLSPPLPFPRCDCHRRTAHRCIWNESVAGGNLARWNRIDGWSSQRERERKRESQSGRGSAPFHSYTRYARSFSFRVKIFSRATFLVDNVEIFVNYDPQFQRPVYTTVYCDNIGGGGQNLSHFGSGIERFLKSITPILRCFFACFFFLVSVFRACRVEGEKKKKKENRRYAIIFLNNERKIAFNFLFFLFRFKWDF